MDDPRRYDSLVARNVYDCHCQRLRSDHSLTPYLRDRGGTCISCGIEGHGLLVSDEGAWPGNFSIRCVGEVFKCDRCALCCVYCLALWMAWSVLGNGYPERPLWH